jgi:hypothetical protein
MCLLFGKYRLRHKTVNNYPKYIYSGNTYKKNIKQRDRFEKSLEDIPIESYIHLKIHLYIIVKVMIVF